MGQKFHFSRISLIKWRTKGHLFVREGVVCNGRIGGGNTVEPDGWDTQLTTDVSTVESVWWSSGAQCIICSSKVEETFTSFKAGHSTESPNRNKMGLYLIGCPIMADSRFNTYILGSTYRNNRLVKTPFTVHTSLHKSFISLSLKPEQFNPLHLASHSPLRLASREDFISAIIVPKVPNGSAPQYISDLLTRLHPGQVSSCSSARAFIVVPRIRSRSSEGGGCVSRRGPVLLAWGLSLLCPRSKPFCKYVLCVTSLCVSDCVYLCDHTAALPAVLLRCVRQCNRAGFSLQLCWFSVIAFLLSFCIELFPILDWKKFSWY